MSKAMTTRLTILQKAFDLIYRKGYQATSIDDIVATTQVTKGAFFYHFKSKEKMGLSIINDIMYPALLPFMVESMGKTNDVRTNIYEMMKTLLLKDPFFKVEYGCPAVNLIEEMSPLNESFRKALMGLMLQWQQIIEAALEKAQKNGQINKSHDPRKIAMYITSNYAGVRNMGKAFGKSSYIVFLEEFKKYLNSIK
jgi:AcrR family transcriptional regulator